MAQRHESSIDVLPLVCRRLLDERQELLPENAQALWNELREIEDLAQDHLQEEHYAKALVGGVTALIILAGSWLRTSPDRWLWCVDQLVRVASVSTTSSFLDRPFDLVSAQSPGFLAEAGIFLLAEQPADSGYRQIVAGAVASHWYGVTAFTMVCGFRERQRLGADWVRMQNLAILWAALCALRLPEEEGVKRPRLDSWKARLIRSFVRGKLASRPLNWVKAALAALRLRDRFCRKQLAQLEDRRARTQFAFEQFRSTSLSRAGLDLWVVMAAFSWLPPLKEAKDTLERAEWVKLYENLLRLAIHPINEKKEGTQDGVDDEFGQRSGGSLSEYHRWFLPKLTTLILQLSGAAERKAFWEPILHPSPGAQDFSDAFLRSWFHDGVQAAPSTEAFVQAWEEMIRYSLDVEASEGRKVHVGFDWHDGLGLGLHPSVALATENYQSAMGKRLALFKDWADRYLDNSRTAMQFSRFLATPGGFELLAAGIIWLAKALPRFRLSQREQLDEAIAEVLRRGFRYCRRSLALDGDLKRAFQDLLVWLVQRGSPAALALQEEIRS